MKSKMQSYQGAAFYVDILGFTALTKGEVGDIKPSDYRAWGLWRKADKNHSFLAATILLEFRDVLYSVKKKYPDVHISHMSDCAFLWSDDVLKLLQAVHYVMWSMTGQKGILCRGGIAYGEIVEVRNVNSAIGEFLVGDAATRAAHNEALLKGPRIAMDVDFPDALWRNGLSSAFVQYYSNELFHPNVSEIDLKTIDEYRWYLCEDDDLLVNRPLSSNERIELTKKRLKLGNYLRFHPRMGWNCREPKGLLQVTAGVKAFTTSDLLSVSHQFATEIPIVDNRKVAHYNAANIRIDQGGYKS